MSDWMKSQFLSSASMERTMRTISGPTGGALSWSLLMSEGSTRSPCGVRRALYLNSDSPVSGSVVSLTVNTHVVEKNR